MTIVAYHELLRDCRAEDVANAAKFLAADPARKFFPAVGEILAQARVEAQARTEHDRLPDLSGVSALPEAERQERLMAGYAASAVIETGVTERTGDLERVAPSLPEKP